MTTDTLDLRPRIAAHLKQAGEATQADIIKALGMADFPSRVTKELNAMRTDALLEAERKGKGPDLTYWLTTSDAPQKKPSPAPLVTAKGDQTRRNEMMRIIDGRRMEDAIAVSTMAETLKCTKEGVMHLLRHAEATGLARRIHEKGGKRGSWIYDPRTPVPPQRTTQHAMDTQPAEVNITGSDASANLESPLVEGIAVQPNPAPVPAVIPSAAPVAVDDTQPEQAPPAPVADEAAERVNDSLPTDTESLSVPPPQYDPDHVAFVTISVPDDTHRLLRIIGEIRLAIGDTEGRITYTDVPGAVRAHIEALEEGVRVRDALIDRTVAALDPFGKAEGVSVVAYAEDAAWTIRMQSAELDQIRALLAERVSGYVDPSDLRESELAANAATMIDDAADKLSSYQTELANKTALVNKLEHLLQSARNEAEHLRHHANQHGADMVNHPPHYQGKVECIDAIETALGAEGFAAYCRGNAIKYAFRAGRKGPGEQDLAKARWYLDRVIP